MFQPTALREKIETRYKKPVGQIIRERYPGMTFQQIADELGVGRNTVYYWLKKSGVRYQKVLVGPGERVEINKN